MQRVHVSAGTDAEIPVQVRSGGRFRGPSGECYGEVSEKEKAEDLSPAFIILCNFCLIPLDLLNYELDLFNYVHLRVQRFG